MMAVAAIQGANQHIRSSLGFKILPKDTLTCRPGESYQWPSDNETLALPLSHSHHVAVSGNNDDVPLIMLIQWISHSAFLKLLRYCILLFNTLTRCPHVIYNLRHPSSRNKSFFRSSSRIWTALWRRLSSNINMNSPLLRGTASTTSNSFSVVKLWLSKIWYSMNNN